MFLIPNAGDVWSSTATGRWKKLGRGLRGISGRAHKADRELERATVTQAGPYVIFGNVGEGLKWLSC